MANEFLTLKSIARQAMPRLIENLVFPSLIHRDFSDAFEVGKGNTIQVRKPVALTAKEFTGTIEAQDVNESSVEVKLDKLATVDVKFSSLEMATNVDDLNRIFIEPAAAALAEKINADGLALLAEVTASVAADPKSLDAFAQASKVLSKAKVPVSPRNGVWTPDAEAMFRTVPSIVNAEKSGTTEALRNGSIGRIFGIDNYMAQGITGNILGAAFHPFAFAFVTRPLHKPSSAESYVTSYGGITLRVTKSYDINTKSEILSMDVLYGYKTMDKNLAVKITAAAE